ncbi:MAG: FAD-binding oxidoreductase [Candidatus Abyssobacteria bacterium SURF_17]|jgi:glycolate oxidase|uniref:FAD-binding oxidoreductase n=1 Tax=Candidatus Abyssobacteria bacterium SURF_17 TaxID=2093361 RepID=A0A419EQ13_9BACT|nr:MAG: FAD-binding oxidoreductase [Candidatus Abyssubacteria bacterium SURF_17]
MSLSKEAYRALEDIVGPEYVTQEPEILDTYCFVWANELIFGEKFSPRPLAVVLPETVEEVQAIVRACNRFGIRYRAHATGFETSAITSSEPFLPIDMRRMNRVVEIDRTNRFAVVEPYVSQARLFLETMKVGLRPNMLGAGPSASVLAGTAAHFGSGPTNISTDFGGRNLLGAEWVLPNGDILRLGSLGTGAGWINGDGPGPSLRGVLRGYGGANGGMGIFTKVATKLYPWYGPPKLQPKGVPPTYGMVIPENFSVYCVILPGRDKMNDFFHLLIEESIAFSIQRLNPALGAILATESNDELWELMKNIPEEQRRAPVFSAIVLLDASSAREMEYKEKCFQMILEQTDGTVFPFDDHIQGLLFNNSVTGQGMTRAAFRSTGSFIISPVGDEAVDALTTLTELSEKEIVKEARDSGQIMETAPEPVWGVVYGDGGAHVEVITMYDPADRASCKKTSELLEKGDKKIVEWGLGINSLENALSFNESALKAALPQSRDFVKWIKKIKRAFDPNNAADSAFYVSPEDY